MSEDKIVEKLDKVLEVLEDQGRKFEDQNKKYFRLMTMLIRLDEAHIFTNKWVDALEKRARGDRGEISEDIKKLKLDLEKLRLRLGAKSLDQKI